MVNYKIKIESARATLVLSPDSVCRLLDGGLEGFDCPECSVTVRPSAFFDGGHMGERRILPRRLALTFEITDLSQVKEVRDTVIRLTDPHTSCLLTVTAWGRTRRIVAVPSSDSVYRQQNFGSYPVVKLCFIAADPFFESEEATKAVLAAPGGASEGDDGTEFSVINGGDVECGFTVKLKAEGGIASVPFISLGEKTLSLSLSLLDGKTAVINTERGRKSVTYDGDPVTVFRRDSEFFALPTGNSVICVGAESGGGYLSAEIEFREKFLSI